MAPAFIPVAPEMKRQSPALMAAAAEERVEEEESDCNYVGGEIAVFVEKLCGAIATAKQAKEEEEEEEEEGEEEEEEEEEQQQQEV
jgi:hypothetical protein